MNSLLARNARCAGNGGRYFENVSQVGDEIRVFAVSLARFIRNLCHGLTVAGGHFKHDAHRFDTRNIARQVGADAETDIDPTAQRPEYFQGLGQRQAVGEHQRLAHRVDAELVVAGDGFFCPEHRITGVVAQAVEELGEIHVEVTEESISGDAVGQGDPQQAAILANPAIKGGYLAIYQPWAELLMGHDPLVGHGAQRFHVQLAGKMHVAGADEAPREIVLEHVHHFFLHSVRKAAPGAEIGNLQLGQFVAAGVGGQPVELAIELLAGLLQNDFPVAIAVTHFADDRQHRYFEQNHMQPRTAPADEQLAVLNAGVDVAQVEAEQAKKSKEIRLHEADALQETQLVGAQAQFGETLDLVTDFRQVRAQILAVTATELPFDFDVRVVVQHRLHHRQFVKVGVEQVLHDAIAKYALAHNGSLHAGRGPWSRRFSCFNEWG